MFSNFIYLIITILIYALYRPSDSPGLSSAEALAMAVGCLVAFYMLSRWFFRRLAADIDAIDAFSADSRHASLLTRQSIMAIVLFAFIVHGLGLPSLFNAWTLFETLPTLLAVCFLLLFLLLLSIVWHNAYPSYRQLYGPDISHRAYIISNWRMSVPILIPWVLISLLADIIFSLPFEAPKQFLSSTTGQVVYFLGFLFCVAVFAPLIIQYLWGCYPLEQGFYRERIEALCRRAGISYRDIMYWPIFGGRMLTAGVMGITHRFRYILVTESLLRSLSPDEVDAVIAHEIGHVKKHHLLYFIFFLISFMLIVFALKEMTIFIILHTPSLYKTVINISLDHANIITTIFSIVFLSLFLVYFRFIFGYFMRTFERQADVYVFSLFNTALPMINTFRKIATTSGQSPDKPNWHHYSIRERIDYLLKCETDRQWIERHNTKAKYSIQLFTLVMICCGVISYQLSYIRDKQPIDANLLETILEQEIIDSPHNPELYSLLGDLKYSQNFLRETADAYEQSLALDPENSQVLNNLAWLYATSEDESVRHPTRALSLALQAEKLDPSAHILDTLAECYFINGDIASAIHVEQRAADTAKEKHTYYQDQLERFRKALEGS